MNLAIDTILVPQGAEYRAVCQGLKQAQLDKIQVKSIPIGVDNLPKLRQDNSFWRTNPQRVLIMGLCGSLSPAHQVGDAVLYQDCFYSDKNCYFTTSQLSTDRKLTDNIYGGLGSQISLVTALTSNRPICKAREKLSLYRTYPASVVDMEGFAYLQELQQRGIAVAMLRIVSDGATDELPDLSGAIDFQGNLQTLPLAIAAIKQPIAAMRLIGGSLKALKVLRYITTKLFIQL